MILVLNASGLLHASSRCAGSGFVFTLDPHGIGEELIGFYGLAFRGLCRRCCERYHPEGQDEERIPA